MTLRLFVALVLAERVRDALARAPLPRGGRGWTMRRVAASNLHLTLRFLGDVEEVRLPAVTGALEEASRGVPPFVLEVAGLGVFPPRGAPRVVWAGVSGGASLLRLARQVDVALAAVGFPPEARPFFPHVTLGRVKGRARGRTGGPVLEEVGVGDFGSSSVEAVTLFESELRPEGARHVARASIPLGRDGT